MQACDDEYWMRRALIEAERAERRGEVPVGAILLKDGELCAADHNLTVAAHDPCGHAEVRVLRAAGLQAENYRLVDCTLYVTLEPCPMCAYAMVHARIKRVVFGAHDPKTGALGGMLDILGDHAWNHRIEIQGGVLAKPCGDVLRRFFTARR